MPGPEPLAVDIVLLVAAAGVGVVVGILSGLTGVGGGIVFVPAAVLLFGLSQHDAQGVSLAVIIPISIVGALSHLRLGNVDRRVVLILAPAAVAGGVAGALIAKQLNSQQLQIIFGLLLLYVGQKYVGLEDFLLRRLRRG